MAFSRSVLARESDLVSERRLQWKPTSQPRAPACGASRPAPCTSARVHRILDEALSCHVGFVVDGEPFVIPTIHARVEETLYLHGSPLSRMLERLGQGARCCVTVTLIDELVPARSARQHSLNYRSATVFGHARDVGDEAEKALALRAVVEHIAPGRSAEVRGPSPDTTRVVSVPIEEASAKQREGPGVDKREDVESGVWAGRLPLELAPGGAIAADDVLPQAPVPEHVERWRAGGAEPGPAQPSSTRVRKYARESAAASLRLASSSVAAMALPFRLPAS